MENNKNILECFKKLNIDINELSYYNNANEFAKTFTKFSLLKNVNVHYSDTSNPYLTNEIERCTK